VAAVALAADTVLLRFSELLDSAGAVAATYLVTPGVDVLSVRVDADPASELLLITSTLEAGVAYVVRADGPRDCNGNPVGTANEVPLLLPEPAGPDDLLLNEVLFNPPPGAADFVELVNVSAKFLDLRGWQLADGRDDTLAAAAAITDRARVLPPGAYLVVTTDAAALLSNYPRTVMENVEEVGQLPPFPNDAGAVVLLNPAGEATQRFDYDEDFHFALLDDDDGVSLERIRFDGPVNDPGNWQSAAQNVGWATPGYRNSQAEEGGGGSAEVRVVPEVITPDQDGDRDFTTLFYRFDRGGYVANVTLYDARGRTVRHLARNDLLGLEGSYKWDGLADDGRRVRVGAYLLHLEVFGLGGEVRTYRKRVVVGARW
ncbi:MAG: lamin tail domain-containing protein, partial [Catalinimonas sp.]